MKTDTIRTQEVPCNLCGSTDSVFLFEARDRLHGIGDTFTYVRCTECGLVYMNPQVIPEDVEKLYPSDYAPHSATTKGLSRIRSLRNHLLKTPVVAHLLKYITNVKIIDRVYRELSEQSRVLDVGCGAGAFLNSVKSDKGCEVYGVDISENAVKRAKETYDLDIFEGAITQVPWPDSSFDVVTAWWYLEHIVDPRVTARKISELLKPNGHCIIGVPNSASINTKCFRDKWYHLDCPRHLCIWTPDTMKRLLEEYGLEVTATIYDKTPWGLLGSLQYSLFGDNINPKYRNRLVRSILLWMLLLPWTMLVSLLRRSDIIVVYAKKTVGESAEVV